MFLIIKENIYMFFFFYKELEIVVLHKNKAF